MADILSRPVVCINLINACFQSVITWALTIRRRDHNNLISTKQTKLISSTLFIKYRKIRTSFTWLQAYGLTTIQRYLTVPWDI